MLPTISLVTSTDKELYTSFRLHIKGGVVYVLPRFDMN